MESSATRTSRRRLDGVTRVEEDSEIVGVGIVVYSVILVLECRIRVPVILQGGDALPSLQSLERFAAAAPFRDRFGFAAGQPMSHIVTDGGSENGVIVLPFRVFRLA